MTYITLEERKKQREINKIFIENLLKDINSDKPYSEKKFLQIFDNSNKENKSLNRCNGNKCGGGQEFFSNQYGSNNVNISNVIYSNYYGHCTPSLF